MQPSLSTYQAAANQIYDPLLQGELGSASAAHTANINTLESQKGGVSATYNDSIYNLNKSTQSNSAKIQQQYTLALGGNFSGLQGNDMGMMFADAAHEQGSIETARDNALNDIGTKQTNETMTYNADVGAIQGKYASQKTQYAQDQYGAAMNAYQQSILDQQKLALEYANVSASSARSGGGAPSAAASKQQASSTTYQNLYSVMGGDNHVGPAHWAQALADWNKEGYSTADFVKQFRQFINPHTGHYAGFN